MAFDGRRFNGIQHTIDNILSYSWKRFTWYDHLLNYLVLCVPATTTTAARSNVYRKNCRFICAQVAISIWNVVKLCVCVYGHHHIIGWRNGKKRINFQLFVCAFGCAVYAVRSAIIPLNACGIVTISLSHSAVVSRTLTYPYIDRYQGMGTIAVWQHFIDWTVSGYMALLHFMRYYHFKLNRRIDRHRKRRRDRDCLDVNLIK